LRIAEEVLESTQLYPEHVNPQWVRLLDVLQINVHYEHCNGAETFGPVVGMRLFRDNGMLTQIWGNNFMVLEVAPPLVIEERHGDEFVRAITGLVDSMHNSASFWTEPLGLARRVINI